MNLLTHGRIAMCGGRGSDRALVDNVARPRLLEQFDPPEDFSLNARFKPLIRLTIWAMELARIGLSRP